jgi:hypothetical protein
MSGGKVDILRSPDLTIRLREGRVYAIENTPPPAPGEAATPSPEPPAAPRPPPAPSDSPVPTFPKFFVGTPEFLTLAGARQAGTAFFAKRAGDTQVYIMTVHHLLGPMGGFDTQVTHGQVPRFVQGILFHELFGTTVRFDVAGCVVPSDGTRSDPRFELAVFKPALASPDLAAVLARTLPRPGEPVWILAQVRGGVPDGELIHRARAQGLDRGWFYCEFENPNIVTAGASGAPVLNSAGEVVGIYEGHIDDNGHKIATIIPSTLILDTLPAL